jgi:hypothetical protein
MTPVDSGTTINKAEMSLARRFSKIWGSGVAGRFWLSIIPTIDAMASVWGVTALSRGEWGQSAAPATGTGRSRNDGPRERGKRRGRKGEKRKSMGEEGTVKRRGDKGSEEKRFHRVLRDEQEGVED